MVAGFALHSHWSDAIHSRSSAYPAASWLEFRGRARARLRNVFFQMRPVHLRWDRFICNESNTFQIERRLYRHRLKEYLISPMGT